MKIAHLILAHKNPRQLERLIQALQHPSFDFYIHVDKKTDANSFKYLINKNIYFIEKRTKIYWAGYGTIQATLNGFDEILEKDYDYINVISAQDFPIKSAEYIYQFIAEKKEQEFITCESIEDEWLESAPRVKKYHFINWRIPGKYRLENIANKILPPRKFPLDYKIVGRANWFTITKNAAQYIVDFLNEHANVIRYFKYCWGADEFIFATILYNSHFKNRIENNLMYVDWSAKKAHPKILTSQDFDALKSSDKLFARKFDMDVDATIIKMLEELLTTKTSTA
ncbi:MAG: beta-1,6-N-acetylglucosaminyltransferase [Chitinophagaceae bacterium]